MSNPFSVLQQYTGEIAVLESEIRSGLQCFWDIAGRILHGSTIGLVAPDPATFSLPRNFFSTLFLYSYYRIGIPAERRIVYVTVNQCLRGMVTGCDNILDDEYKTTLETDLPQQAHRFRSVLDIMVADRVLFALMLEYCRRFALPLDLAVKASTASLQALTQSGVQEAAEEGGVGACLLPEDILRKIHHYKTGLLFQSPWVIPALIEQSMSPEAQGLKEALYHIGIGCQLLDDIADLFIDVRGKRHNYVASVVAHEERPEVGESMRAHLAGSVAPEGFYAAWPDLAARIRQKALTILEQGLGSLFLARHQALVRPASCFIAERIGVSLE